MMEDMKLQLEKEAKEEAELFEKAMCMCDGGEAELKKTIAFLSGEVDRLTHKQEEEKAERAKLVQDVDAHKTDLENTKKTLYEAEELRMKDAKKYQDDEMMNKFSVDSITQALRLFEKEGSAASFVQQGGTSAKNFRRIIEVSRFLTPTNREKVLEFLDEGSENLKPGEMSSGVAQIVGVLKGMKDEISQNMVDDKNEEHQNNEDFKEMKSSKLEHIGVLEKTIADKKKRAGDLRLSIAQDHDALLDGETELLNSNNYLKNLASDCAEKAKMKDMRAKMKADEIAAVGEAIAILTEDTARDTLTKAQPPSAAFMQQTLQQRLPEQDYEAFLQVSKSVEREAAPHKPFFAERSSLRTKA
jgi:hypothetical protein